MQNKTLTLALITTVFASAQIASASGTFTPSFDSRSESDGDPSPTNATDSDLAVGPVSSGRAFRTYLTFDLTSASSVGAGGTVELTLGTSTSSAVAADGPNESNTDTLEQDFNLFSLGSDWDGSAGAGPVGTTIDTVTLTPSLGNHGGDLVFSGTGLVSAYNSAVGGNLYLGILSSEEGTDARSFIWFGSVEDGVGRAPTLVAVPEASSALLGAVGLLFLLRRRR